AVAHAQAEMRAVQDVAVAIDDVTPVTERVARIEGEEFVFDGDGRIACRGDSRKQVEGATEFRVKYGAARQDGAGFRAAAERERATHPLIRLVDRDVLASPPRVADAIRGRRQSAKPATDDMRLHRPPPWTPGTLHL